jgi:hypothetical protein
MITIRGRLVDNAGSFVQPASAVTEVIGMIPQLPLMHVDAVATNRCASMFEDCVNMTSARVVVYPLGSYNYPVMDGYLKRMFYNCTALETLDLIIPTLPKHATSFNDYLYQMCYNCTNLRYIGNIRFPYDTFHEINLAENCYFQSFYNVGSALTAKLTKNPMEIINGNPRPAYMTECFSNMFPNRIYVADEWLQDVESLTAELVVSKTSTTYSTLYIRHGYNGSLSAIKDIKIDWGDGTVTKYDQGASVPREIYHNYTKTGTYVVEVTGPIIAKYQNNTYNTGYSFFGRATNSSSYDGYMEITKIKGHIVARPSSSADYSYFLYNMFGTTASPSSVAVNYCFFNKIQEIDVTISEIPSNATDLSYFMRYFAYGQTQLTKCRVKMQTMNMPTTVVNATYFMNSAFAGCSLLETADEIDLPALSEGVISARNYMEGIFSGSGLLSTVQMPPLPSTVTSAISYGHTMYQNSRISSYVTGHIPDLPDNVTDASFFMLSAFQGCTNLTLDGSEILPKILSPFITTASQYYQETFRGCTSLAEFHNTIPDLESNVLTSANYFLQNIFADATSLSVISQPLPKIKSTSLSTVGYMYNNTFNNGGPITEVTIPDVDTLPNLSNMIYFMYNIFMNNLRVSELTINAPRIVAPRLSALDYYMSTMIQGCTALATLNVNFPENAITTNAALSISYFMQNGFALQVNTSSLSANSLDTINITNFPVIPPTTTSMSNYMYQTFAFSTCSTLNCDMPQLNLPNLTTLQSCYLQTFYSMIKIQNFNADIKPIIAPKLKIASSFMTGTFSYFGASSYRPQLDADIGFPSSSLNNIDVFMNNTFSVSALKNNSSIRIGTIACSATFSGSDKYMYAMCNSLRAQNLTLDIAGLTASNISSMNRFMADLFSAANITFSETSYIGTITANKISSLNNFCERMFLNTTLDVFDIVISSPAVPSISTAKQCMSYMFSGSEIASFTKPLPQLNFSQTTDVSNYMEYAFSGTTAPTYSQPLPDVVSDSVITAQYFCQYMFYTSGFTDITSDLPELSGSNISNIDYFLYYTFSNMNNTMRYTGAMPAMNLPNLLSANYYMAYSFYNTTYIAELTITSPNAPKLQNADYYLYYAFARSNIQSSTITFDAVISDLVAPGLLSANYFCAYAFSYSSVTSYTTHLPKIVSSSLINMNYYMAYMFQYSKINSFTEHLEFGPMDNVIAADYFLANMFYYATPGPSVFYVDAPVMPSITSITRYMNNMFAYTSTLTSFVGSLPAPTTTKLKQCNYERYRIFNESEIQTISCAFSAWADNTIETMSYVCANWFYNCDKLTTIDAVIPAPTSTNLKTCTYCYYSLFNGCKALVQFPQVEQLPSTQLTDITYYAGYFANYCQSIQELDISIVPAILSEEIVTATGYFYYAFGYMTPTTIVGNVPVIPSNKLVEANYYCAYCYYGTTTSQFTSFPPHVNGTSLVSVEYYMYMMFALIDSHSSAAIARPSLNIIYDFENQITDLIAPNALYTKYYMYSMFEADTWTSNNDQTLRRTVVLGTVGHLQTNAAADISYYMGRMFRSINDGYRSTFVMNIDADISPNATAAQKSEYYMYQMIYSSGSGSSSSSSSITFNGNIGGLTANSLTSLSNYMYQMIYSSGSSGSGSSSSITFNGNIGGLTANSLTSLSNYMYRMIYNYINNNGDDRSSITINGSIGGLTANSLTSLSNYMYQMIYNYMYYAGTGTLTTTLNCTIEGLTANSLTSLSNYMYRMIYNYRATNTGNHMYVDKYIIIIDKLHIEGPTCNNIESVDSYMTDMIYYPAISGGILATISDLTIHPPTMPNCKIFTSAYNRILNNNSTRVDNNPTNKYNITILPATEDNLPAVEDISNYCYEMLRRDTTGAAESDAHVVLCDVNIGGFENITTIKTANRYCSAVLALSTLNTLYTQLSLHMAPLPNSDTPIEMNYYLSALFVGAKLTGATPINAIQIPAPPTNIASADNYFRRVFEKASFRIDDIPHLPDGVVHANNYLYRTYNANTSLSGLISEIDIPALPQSVIYSDYYLYQLFNAVTATAIDLIIPPLPATVLTAEYYMNGTFLNMESLYNIINLTLPAEPDVVKTSQTSYTQLLNDAGRTSSYTPTKTATSIIGTAATPTTPRNAISNKFTDFATLPTNWKQTSSIT